MRAECSKPYRLPLIAGWVPGWKTSCVWGVWGEGGGKRLEGGIDRLKVSNNNRYATWCSGVSKQKAVGAVGPRQHDFFLAWEWATFFMLLLMTMMAGRGSVSAYGSKSSSCATDTIYMVLLLGRFRDTVHCCVLTQCYRIQHTRSWNYHEQL